MGCESSRLHVNSILHCFQIIMYYMITTVELCICKLMFKNFSEYDYI